MLKVTKEQIVHEKSYKGANPVAFLHRKRLERLAETFETYAPAVCDKWADIGCSNGFIIEHITQSTRLMFNTIVGYDHSQELLVYAREKKIPNCKFEYIDLNTRNEWETKYNIVTCFETLEHVGDINQAVNCIFEAAGDNSVVVISVPNEVGIIGLVKLIARWVARKNPYGDFFNEKSVFRYIWTLLTYGYIDNFREPDKSGYGPHLGFDYRKLQHVIDKKIENTNTIECKKKVFTLLRMNVIYIYSVTAA